MPEMRMAVRWPDGSQESCYSPSRVLKDYFRAGESYGLADFQARSRTALEAASARVEAKYGFSCSRAREQLARIEVRCRSFVDFPDAQVRVEALHE